MQTRRSTGIRRVALTLVAGGALLVGCGQADDDGPAVVDPGDEVIDDEGARGDTPDDAPETDTGSGEDGDGDGDGPGEADTGEDDAQGSDSREITLAIADAADRLDVAVEEVEFVSFEMVTWPDSALGCPEPGEMYTQALVEGYRIVVAAEGTELTYHGAVGDDPFLCEDPQEPVERS